MDVLETDFPLVIMKRLYRSIYVGYPVGKKQNQKLQTHKIYKILTEKVPMEEEPVVWIIEAAGEERRNGWRETDDFLGAACRDRWG